MSRERYPMSKKNGFKALVLGAGLALLVPAAVLAQGHGGGGGGRSSGGGGGRSFSGGGGGGRSFSGGGGGGGGPSFSGGGGGRNVASPEQGRWRGGGAAASLLRTMAVMREADVSTAASPIRIAASTAATAATMVATVDTSA